MYMAMHTGYTQSTQSLHTGPSEPKSIHHRHHCREASSEPEAGW
jgi:hypothetical protein